MSNEYKRSAATSKYASFKKARTDNDLESEQGDQSVVNSHVLILHSFPHQVTNGDVDEPFDTLHYPEGLPELIDIITKANHANSTKGVPAELENVPDQWNDSLANEGILERANVHLNDGRLTPVVGTKGAKIRYLVPNHPYMLTFESQTDLDAFRTFLQADMSARFKGVEETVGLSYTVLSMDGPVVCYHSL